VSTPSTSTIPPYFLQAGCPSCRPTNSVKALKAILEQNEKGNNEANQLTQEELENGCVHVCVCV